MSRMPWALITAFDDFAKLPAGVRAAVAAAMTALADVCVRNRQTSAFPATMPASDLEVY
eukprot:m.3623 g.3623  ORF g.3623 m.3623 type:complete len:59 (-) comp1510_c0_seq2:45-221(-)